MPERMRRSRRFARGVRFTVLTILLASLALTAGGCVLPKKDPDYHPPVKKAKWKEAFPSFRIFYLPFD